MNSDSEVKKYEINSHEMPLISVILPVYNVSDYLQKCIDSVIQQDYKNLEIILVDDGSTDDSGKKCDEYSKQDERILVIHQNNKGLSGARNTGTSIAKGEYISYVDSDDYIDSNYISYLYSLIAKYKTKISLCTHRVIKNGSINEICNMDYDEVLVSEDCLKRMLYHDVIDTSAWGKLYHKDLCQKISFPEGMLFEDIGTTYKFFIESKTIACGYKPLYNYIIRNNSITTGEFNYKKLDLITLTDKMGNDVMTVFPNLEKAILRRRVYARLSVLNKMENVKNNSIKQEIIKFIRMNGKTVLRDKNSQKRDRIAIILLSISYSLYKFAWEVGSRYGFTK